MLFYTNIYKRGKFIYFRGVENGKRVSQKFPLKPTLYVKSTKQSKYKSLWGEDLEPVKFESLSEAKDFVDKYKDVSNFPIFGQTNFIYQFISKYFPNEIKFDISQIVIYSIDIETSANLGFPDPKTALEEVLLITIQDNTTKQITTFGCKPYDVETENTKYIQCDNEQDLLDKFIKFISSRYPDVITGWNCQLFDIAYLSSRIEKVLGAEALMHCSPHGVVSQRDVNLRGNTLISYKWEGITILDYLDLYKKFAFKILENYSLDYVAKEELGKEKIKHQYNTFREFYTNDWQLFTTYNITDCMLVDEMEDKLKLINLALTVAYNAKCNYIDVFSPVRTWDCILYNALLKRDVIIHNPPDVDEGSDRTIMGAFVKDPIPGQYDWVVSFDATSLYPSIMMTFNMSPETLIDGQKHLPDTDESIAKFVEREASTQQLSDMLHNEDITMTANGQCFRKDRKGIFPELIEFYFAQRQKAKKAMIKAQEEQIKITDTSSKQYKELQNKIAALNSQQMASKILMNSLYGALGNMYFRYYDIRIAEGITMTGQLIIRTVGKAINERLNQMCKTTNVDYAFYSDTDSIYITLKTLVDTYFSSLTTREIVSKIDAICNDKIEPAIQKACNVLSDYSNVFQRKITFKREVIADRGVWIRKKRYALNVHNAEGVQYDKPKLKVMGMEIVRSSTPFPVRTALKEAVNIVLTKDEETLKSYIREFEEKWTSMKPEEIAFPRSVQGLLKYGGKNGIIKKGTPVHVRGALLYNQMIVAKGIDKKYQTIHEGDKIKFIYLNEPNPIGMHVIAFPGTLPEEFNLGSYIDYDKMLMKTFLDPLESLLKTMKWQIKEQATLDDLFG